MSGTGVEVLTMSTIYSLLHVVLAGRVTGIVEFWFCCEGVLFRM